MDGPAVGEISVRPVDRSSLRAVEEGLANRPAPKHRQRFTFQRRGLGLYLIAWEGRDPVGHAVLKWPGPGSSPRGQAERCPEIEDLHVLPGRRRRRVATRLLEACERLSAQRGYRTLGLAVGVDNVPARALYDRGGFSDAGHGEFAVSGRYWGDDGVPFEGHETCVYLTKPIAPA
jgi:GNAT superfamily N-acetyltransferase